ncbi:taste receptor type 1 member 1-like [Melanotaenia boesemani]|uniref:taste receptor type 1 member 1-like n=1 Tax=Melanotaenia boesemani TaxID=1250792 RepID=UPI001C05DE24|nr:taste receptor type 1 member 1-like [Melanotaenia boesemani]
MKPCLASLCLLGASLHALSQCTATSCKFYLEGDYSIGGLFDIHYIEDPVYHDRPEVIDCSSQRFSLSNYRRFELMRFSVEEINNSTNLLPNVSLGYELFDHCSDTLSFPEIFKLISVNGLIHPWAKPYKDLSKVIAVVGPFTSTQSLTVAPLFMVNLIPVVSYGSSSSALSDKIKFPSFLRTVHSNRDLIEVIVTIVQHFKWNWVAFLNSDNDYGNDGRDLFIKRIKDTKICLAYTTGLSAKTNYSQVFRNIERDKIYVIIVFAPELAAETLIGSAIQLNITNKVWIAGDSWSLSKRLQKIKRIKTIGTVLGVSQPIVSIPGFSDFLHSSKSHVQCGDDVEGNFCGQVCNCSHWSAEEVLDANPSYTFAVYSAVYAIAHALHRTMQCGAGGCKNLTVYQNKVLEELLKSNFTLLNQTIQFDENGNIKFGFYTVVFWNQSGKAQNVGFYNFHPKADFFINSTKIMWYADGKVPTSLCSSACPEGYVRKQKGLHVCCYNCEICPSGTYVNITENPFKCINCMDTEWSTAGSTSCSLRLVEYIPFTATGAIVIMVGTCVLVGLSLAVSVLFAINYNTPVVRSAGGPMCFLILICLGVCSFSVFFYFGQPTPVSCVLRYFPFILFYTVCLACFVVRSFQIVCIFKMAAKIPKFHSWWMKYHGQWLLIAGAFVTQAVFLISIFYDPPKPYNETSWYPEQIVLFCGINLGAACALILPLLLCCLCFIFSYMGKDLPKNYNEAKAITFCLLLLIFTWIIFVTVFMLYRGKNIQTFNGLAVLSSLYSFLLWYFLPKCYIIIFQPHKNTQQYFQGLIQNYTKTISQ